MAGYQDIMTLIPPLRNAVGLWHTWSAHLHIWPAHLQLCIKRAFTYGALCADSGNLDCTGATRQKKDEVFVTLHDAYMYICMYVDTVGSESNRTDAKRVTKCVQSALLAGIMQTSSPCISHTPALSHTHAHSKRECARMCVRILYRTHTHTQRGRERNRTIEREKGR